MSLLYLEYILGVKEGWAYTEKKIQRGWGILGEETYTLKNFQVAEETSKGKARI